GGGGIGEVFRLSIGRDYAAQTYAIILLLLVTIIAIDQLSGWMRRRLVGDQSFNFAKASV
ncbi:phosphonate ABC transporter, permease protein PhnE, partial [Nostoc sp. 3335mG]